MNNETLNRANQIQAQIACIDRMLVILEKDVAVEINFNNGGYSCCSNKSDYISDEEVDEIKNNITSLIRLRAEALKDELEKEFFNL